MSIRVVALLVMTVLALPACGSARQASVAASADTVLRPGVPLSSPRATHATVSTGGQLLLIGGCVRDGCDAGPSSATVDMIALDGSPDHGVGRLQTPRVQPGAAALPGGRALVTGGWVNGQIDSSTEIFDVATRSSRPGPAMLSPRSAAMLVPLADGRVLIAGGYDGARPLASAEIFDLRTGRLQRVGDLLAARSGASATLLQDGRVLIAGGGTGDGDDRVALSTAEIFDPSTGRFTPTGSLGQRRYKHGAVAMADGGVLLVGGADERDYGGKLDTVERFDPATGRFAAAGRLVQPRFKLADASVLLPSGKILVAGGYDRPELFDPASGTSRLLNVSLGGQWNYLTAAMVGGRVFLAGGYSEGSIHLSDRNWLLTI